MSLAPPAVKDGFSYAGGSIYVEASGHNRHRRATIPELKAHFKGSKDVKDPPAHWYEAQLLHYGLPPSKTKGTAKMRLFEAVNRGTMIVPAHIQKLEAELKKEWTKNEREAKKALKQRTTPASTAKGTKRKAEAVVASATNINLNLSLLVNSAGTIQIQTTEQPKKKTKTTAPTAAEKATKTARSPATTAKKAANPKVKESKKPATPTVIKKEATKPRPADKAKKSTESAGSKAVASALKTTGTKKDGDKALRKPQTARRGGSSVGSRASGSANPAISSQVSAVPRSKNLARRGGTSGFGLPKGPSLTSHQTSPQASRTPMKKQTARRGGMSNGGEIKDTGTTRSFDTAGDSHDEPPPPDSEYPKDLYQADHYGSDSDGYDNYANDINEDLMDVEEQYDDNEQWPLEPLGLLNGRYTIDCPSLTAQHDPAGDDAGLILTLDGNSLWGSFDFGGINGILHSPERPWQSSDEDMRFSWRGTDYEGHEFRGDEHVANICFFGGGRIRGEILSDYSGWHAFRGQRVSGQETRSEISAWSMRRQWDELQW